MKNTIADNKQILNVKALAVAGLTLDNIPNNQVGLVNVSTGQTVVPNNFGAVPDKFQFVAKVNNKVYYSIDEIEKAKIVFKTNQDYAAPQAEIWKTIIQCCKCIDTVQLTIGVSNTAVVGSNLTPAFDFVYEVAPEELKCYCACDGNSKELENNVFTKIIVNKINNSGSTFYKAYAEIPLSAATSGANFPGVPTDGQLFEKTGASAGLYVYTAGGWTLVGELSAATTEYIITDIDSYVAALDARNKDANPINHGPLMTLVLESLVGATPLYHDLEPNYIYPRGTTLFPTFNADNSTCFNQFTKTQDLVYEIGAGYDLRAEEFEIMSYYTNLNNHPTIGASPFQAADLIYQIDNGVNYNTINLEFQTDKVNTNGGDKKSFNITLAIPTGVAAYGTLKTAFGL